MKCYICNKEYKNVVRHAERMHPDFVDCFKFLARGTYIDDELEGWIPPLIIEPYAGEEKVNKLSWYEYEFEDVRDTRRQWFGQLAYRSTVVPHLEPMPMVEFVPNEFLPVDFFGEYPDSLATIRRVEPEYLPFALPARMLCEQCGGYGRKRHCPPVIMVMKEFREWILQWKGVYIIVWQSDGRAGWVTRPEGVGRRYCRGLRGVDNGLAASAVHALVDISERIWDDGIKAYMCPPGPCKKCRRNPCVLPSSAIIDTPDKGCCRYPLLGGATPESMGIDVINLLWGMGIPVQQPLFDFLTKVGVILTEELL
jgi:predicted metal-binding protein